MSARAAALSGVLLALAAAGCREEILFTSDDQWPGVRDVPELGAGKIIVTNSGDDTLSWIDPVTLEVVYRQPVGLVPPEREAPHHGVADPAGGAFFIGLSNFLPGAGSGPHGAHGIGSVPGYLLKYDALSLELLGVTRVDRSPGDVRITPDGTTVVQTHFDLLKIQDVAAVGGDLEDMIAPLAIIDATTMRLRKMVPVCPAGHGVQLSSDSARAYVACWASDELAIVELTAPYAVSRHHVGEAPIDPTSPTYEPYAVAESPRDGTLWVSNLRTSDVRIFDPVALTWDTQGPIAVGGAPFFGAFSRDGATFYLPVQTANALTVIDVATKTVLTSLTLLPEACLAPHAVLLLEEQSRALVVCEGDRHTPGTVAVVSIVDRATPSVEKVLTVGVYPDDAFLVTAP